MRHPTHILSPSYFFTQINGYTRGTYLQDIRILALRAILVFLNDFSQDDWKPFDMAKLQKGLLVLDTMFELDETYEVSPTSSQPTTISQAIIQELKELEREGYIVQIHSRDSKNILYEVTGLFIELCSLTIIELTTLNCTEDPHRPSS